MNQQFNNTDIHKTLVKTPPVAVKFQQTHRSPLTDACLDRLEFKSFARSGFL